MTLPVSGAITMAQVAAELGISASGLSLNDSRVRALAGVPSGPISLGQLHGRSNAVAVNIVYVGGSSYRANVTSGTGPFTFRWYTGAYIYAVSPYAQTTVIDGYNSSGQYRGTSFRVTVTSATGVSTTSAPYYISAWDGASSTCFPADSLVLTASYNWKLIQEIVPGEWIMGADGIPTPVVAMDRPTLGTRRMMTMGSGADQIMWSEEHSFWTSDAAGQEWWWSVNPDMWRGEVESGDIGGLLDNSTLRYGDGYAFAHVKGWKQQQVKEAGAFPEATQLYLPRTNGVPIIVNGYVVGAAVNQKNYDYSKFAFDVESFARLNK